jgi:creatinine amidohydrolase/Fe(II)-dependent formamide hydrolase-like protein
MLRPALTLLSIACVTRAATAQRPPDTVFLEDLTWTEVRDLQRAGARTIIIGTAGQEQKGPHMVTGEHKFVMRYSAEQIARALGQTLVAPIITYVPEGGWDPPLRGHMTKPGTITLPQDRFVDLLVDAGESLRAGGFTTVILVGDSGGNQDGMQEAAERLNASWKGHGARAVWIGDYYTKGAADVRTYLTGLGYALDDVGSHAGMTDTSKLMYLHPSLIRRDKLANKGGSPESGVSGDPTKASAELGKAMLKIHIDDALAQIRAELAVPGDR